MVQRVYKNGLPFSTGLDLNIDKLQERVDNKKSALLIIDGGLGEGKTTLMIHILDYINKINKKGPIDLKGPQLALGGVDFLKKLRACYEDKLPCIGYDEAGDFSRRGSLTNFNAMINRTFETFRAFKCIVVLCLPSFYVLDQELLDKNIPRLLLHLKNRSNKQGNFYGYSLYRLQLLKARMNKYNIKNYAFVKVFPNFYGHFIDLDPVRCRELDEISTKNKINVLQKAEVKIEGLLTYNEMAVKLMRSLKWTRNTIRVMKIKPVRIIKNVKYFETNVVNELADIARVKDDRRHKVKDE